MRRDKREWNGNLIIPKLHIRYNRSHLLYLTCISTQNVLCSVLEHEYSWYDEGPHNGDPDLLTLAHVAHINGQDEGFGACSIV
jgi:hypothetical protein